MADAFLKGLAARRDPLLAEIVRFNFLPSSYIHPSWTRDLAVAGPLWDRLARSRRAHAHLSALVLESFGLGDDYCLDFRDPGRRLALLDGAALARIALFVGVVLSAPWVTRIIHGGTLRALKAGIGVEAYEFAVKRAPFLRPGFESPPLDDGPGGGDGGDPSGRVRRAGLACLAACFADEPAAVVNRLRLKFPRDGQPPVGLGDEGGGAAAGLAPKAKAVALVHRVIREVASSWAPSSAA